MLTYDEMREGIIDDWWEGKITKERADEMLREVARYDDSPDPVGDDE